MVAWPEVVVAPAQAARLGRGQAVAQVAGPAGEVAILDHAGRALGLGQLDAEARLQPKRLFAWATQQAAGPAAAVAGDPPANG